MTEDAQEKLYDILVSDGMIASELFEELAIKMLEDNHGYSEDDFDDMGIADLLEIIGDIFGVVLEEDANMNVNLIDFINN